MVIEDEPDTISTLREPEVIDLSNLDAEVEANGDDLRNAPYRFQLRGSVWHKVAEYEGPSTINGTPIENASPIDAVTYALEHGDFGAKAQSIATSIQETMRQDNFYITLYRQGDLNQPVSMSISQARSAELSEYISPATGVIPISVTDDDPGGAGLEDKIL